jgi:hypothetical protein
MNFSGATPQYEKLGQSPNSKTQQSDTCQIRFRELEFVTEITTSSKTPHG